LQWLQKCQKKFTIVFLCDIIFCHAQKYGYLKILSANRTANGTAKTL
jgi:hypothetical protein